MASRRAWAAGSHARHASAGGAGAGGNGVGGSMPGALVEQPDPQEARRAWLPAAQALLDAMRLKAQRFQLAQQAQQARALTVRHNGAVARLAALARPSLIPPQWAAQGSWVGAPRAPMPPHNPQPSNPQPITHNQ